MELGSDLRPAQQPARTAGYCSTKHANLICRTGVRSQLGGESCFYPMPSFDQLIVWIVTGLIGGALAGVFMTWERGGFGLFRNLALGLAGALIGGLLFRLFGIWPTLDKIAISLRDVIAAFVGSLVVLAALWIWRKFSSSEVSH